MMKSVIKINFKVFEIIFFILILAVLIFIIFTNEKNDLKAHCSKAVCNEDSTICYNYKIDNSGKTIKTWEGNCSKLK